MKTKIKIITPFVILVCFFMLTGCFNCNSWIENHIKPQRYNGIIQTISEEQPGFKKIIILQEKETIELSFCKVVMGSNVWLNIIKVGDTIQKEKGSDIIRLKQQDGNIIEFRYPCCDW
jgi:hypothetical protein